MKVVAEGLCNQFLLGQLSLILQTVPSRKTWKTRMETNFAVRFSDRSRKLNIALEAC